MARSWRLDGRIGRWEGVVDVPAEERGRPIAAAIGVLDRFFPALATLHRPREIHLGWGEYDGDGAQITAREGVEVPVGEWGAIRDYLEVLRTGTPNRVALMSIFIQLDTSIVDASGEAWCERSAVFQTSMTPPWLEPPDAGVGYTTHIDIWLSTTYDRRGVPRSNRDAAARNRPRLRAFLRQFAALVGPSFEAGLSRLYPSAITPTGFRDVADLPPRGGRES